MYWLSRSSRVQCRLVLHNSGVQYVSRYTKFNVSVVAKSAKKRDAESAKDAEVRWARVVGSCGGLGYMLALVVGLLIASLLTQLTNCQSLACTAHKVIEYGSVRKCDGENFSALTLLSGTIRQLDDCTTQRR